jgi:hypothetical protein
MLRLAMGGSIVCVVRAANAAAGSSESVRLLLPDSLDPRRPLSYVDSSEFLASR